MRFTFTEEEEGLRKEVCDFLGKELPKDWFGGPTCSWADNPDEEAFEYGRLWDRKLAAKGWPYMAWPKEYGGQQRSYVEQAIYNETRGYYRVPTGGAFGLLLAGPTIMKHGTEEQKKKYLPPIARAEVIWCQGFTEPTAGSDLASLKTRAVETRDCYVINGEKIYISFAHHADWCMLLARTDPDAPKHRGISYFLVDMKTPGITLQPIWLMGGGRVDRIIFKDVLVPKENLLGEKNRGWYVAVTTLGYERGGITRAGQAKRILDDLVKHVKVTLFNGELLSKNPQIQDNLAELAIEIEIARLYGYWVARILDKGEIPGYQGSMAKGYAEGVLQRVANLGMHILDEYGTLQSDSKWAPLKGTLEQWSRFTVCCSLMGGTREIQRNIVATRGLGLPRT